ncbi:pyridoxamine 5'-phosphate oxidase family protein [Gayadomonas joobiniege]|uniref:pyridoxamine 5'-phosphate oxidase family protein n=1 Tax=Gayadomonas joobiniege TaxID=1234606 RepID=UPI000371AC8F|nr:pyridoxamine 5'-phosphate oxidase family protein [Gayadomonas joobiniege]
MKSPFHDGERHLQTQIKVQDKIASVGASYVRDYLPLQHRNFYHQLAMIFTAWMDHRGHVWASVLCNPAGFIKSPDEQHLQIVASPLPCDPLNQLSTGDHLGLLGLSFHNQRRNRANGWVTKRSSESIQIKIKQTFGNCPKHIKQRFAQHRTDFRLNPHTCKTVQGLDNSAVELIKNADTFFVASASGQKFSIQRASDGLDISHRGGPAGFIQMISDRTLLIPDYKGNQFFNTLGNILLYPQAGLLFIDFNKGHLLSLSGTAQLLPNVQPSSSALQRPQNWSFTINQGVWLYHALPFFWRNKNNA